MKSEEILHNLLHKNIISDEQAQRIDGELNHRPFSVYHELRSILYIGISLLCSGTGVIIYENIDSIGHQVIMILISLITAGCFYFSVRNLQPFTWDRTTGTHKLSDYILLLGCAMFLILEGYMQYQYQVFGVKYGLAVAIPTVIFFYCAYRFDHAGVLSMAITGLACWLGLTIAPFSIISKNDFSQPALVVTAIILGIALVIFGQVSLLQNIKKHFTFTYTFLGGNLASVAALAGLFNHDYPSLYTVAGISLSTFFVMRARQSQSLVFLLMGVIYGYIILTYSFFSVLGDVFAGFIAIYYFLFSSIGVIVFLLNYKKILGIRK